MSIYATVVQWLQQQQQQQHSIIIILKQNSCDFQSEASFNEIKVSLLPNAEKTLKYI